VGAELRSAAATTTTTFAAFSTPVPAAYPVRRVLIFLFRLGWRVMGREISSAQPGPLRAPSFAWHHLPDRDMDGHFLLSFMGCWDMMCVHIEVHL
jgi:hypothetical protein